ncbi:MAG: hypothetical protein OSJ34_02725 [Muribaculaceae bacterium]|jgi:hypothetical protein|nr:hypothetical protein [Muribaculaceae bacterium]
MKLSGRILAMLLSVVFLAGCSSAFDQDIADAGSSQVTFFIETEKLPHVNVNSRGEDGAALRLSQLRYAIADSEGRILNPHYQKLESDFSKLTIEGLRYGDYTVVFLAVADTGCADAEITDLSVLQDVWLENSDTESPVDGIYYYKKVEFSIGKDQAPISQQIVLELCVGRVDIDLNVSSEYMWRFIKEVKVTFDDDAGVPVGLTASGQYVGEGSVRSYDITGGYSFCSFPSDVPLSGIVEIKSEMSNGEEFSYHYRFEGCNIEAGRISHIAIDYRHPESSDGLLYVREKDMSRFDTDTMFLADEPQAVFYDANRRSFHVDAPLQVSITDNHKLGVKFFAPVTIRDVRVKCRFSKISHEFFELARFDAIYPFMEASFTLPVVERDATFTTESGRKINIPAQTELTADDVTLIIECEDPFMKKIEEIDSHWYIRFSAYGADSGHAYWRHMTPLLCRHGVALALNMAYMFSSSEFSTELDKYDGILFDNGKNPIDLDALRIRIRNHGGLMLGRVVGVGGLGGGSTYGLADYCYTGVYFDATAPGSNPHNYSRQAMFHEYGHCLGYNHSSNMTYGDRWTVLCATVFVNMGQSGKLPVNSKDEVGTLPM